MNDLVRLAPGALHVGKPIPWHVYDRHGNLLVAQGYVLQNDGQLERLYQRGLYDPPHRWERPVLEEETNEEELEDVNPFREYGGLLSDLANTLEAITTAREDARAQLISLAKRLHVLCRSDQDAALALIHVYSVRPTAQEQTLFYGILAWFMAQSLKLDKDQLITLLAAALTANLALLPFQDKLNQSNRILDDAQRAIVRKHPTLSARAVENAGMSNRDCIEVIEQHHEQQDGTGYPKGLKGDDIRVEARIIAVAERYVAMITQRAYRHRFRTDEALRSMMRDGQGLPDKSVFRALYRVMGANPPGTLVRLANNETAVVIRRPRAGQGVQVKSLLNPQGHPYVAPFPRDTEIDDWAIQEMVLPTVMPALDLNALWGYG